MNVDINEPYKLSLYQRFYLLVKLVFDFLASLAAFIILLPVFLVITVLIKLEEGINAPVLFKQKRIGKNKKEFLMYKFRTMRIDTPHDVPTHLLSDPDAYITKTGKILRKTSLDELPQLVNILKGEMSVCGPRPALWNQFDLIELRESYGVNQLRPGLTGWAQIHGRDELEISEKAWLDAFYLTKLGFVIDIKCIFGTIISVLRHDGVVEGGTGQIHLKETRETDRKKNRPKILVLTNHSYMFWRFRKELVEELMHSFDITLSTPFVGHEDDLSALGCKVIETPFSRRGINVFNELKLFQSYCKLISTESPDIVITYSVKPNIYGGIAAGKHGIPYFVNIQGLGTAFENRLLSVIIKRLYSVACRKASAIFFENSENARFLIDEKVIPQENVVVMPGAGVNLENYPYQVYHDDDQIHFLYLGRIMREKGIDELFEAMRKLHSEVGDSVVLDIVGFIEEEDKDRYGKEINELVSEKTAVFHGFQYDPLPYYRQSDCVVLPSYHEGMSNVLLEGASCGRCLITTDIPGCRETVDDGVTGFLCKVKDPQSLYEAMKKFTLVDRTEREELGRNGRNKMIREFNRNVIVRDTVAVIEKALLKNEK